jgi:endonuclease-8
MEGSWHIYRADERWRRPAFQARAVLGTKRFQTVGFSLGVVALLDTDSEGDVVGHLGPDLLGPDWNAPEAIRRLDAEPTRPVGDALLDQRLMAGLGNVYRSEVCFLAGVHPDSAVGECNTAQIVSISKRVIEANRDTGSQVTTGDPRPGHDRWVYGRRAKPCRRCSTPILKRGDGHEGRILYWCPTCQPVLRTDRATAEAG